MTDDFWYYDPLYIYNIVQEQIGDLILFFGVSFGQV